MRVLIVEDEKKVASFITGALEEEGYTVDVAYDGDEGLAHGLTAEYDLIVLDHLLPSLSGRAVCQELRRTGIETPILMLTARSAIEDRIAGLDAGADDYLTKPFALGELSARARALIRRRSKVPLAILKVENLTLDPLTRRVHRGERAIDLTAREYALLEYLMRNAGRPVTRALIAEHVWGFDFDAGTNVIDVYINYLRGKVDRTEDQKLIRTIRSVGYQLG
jgi:DNA-binding response OmpR family regulator